jgi:Uma2 family endonuclease
MNTRRPLESTERNAPSVEAAFQATPMDLMAEILEGELHISPHPARPTLNALSNLSALLGMPFVFGRGGTGGWVILKWPEIHLGPRPDKLVPDLAGWTRERMPDAVGQDETLAHYDLVPDWVCEILSEHTRSRDKGQKMRIYARDGVRHLWHVDPLARTLEIFRLQENQWVLVHSFTGEARVRAEPFEALELELALVWSR